MAHSVAVGQHAVDALRSRNGDPPDLMRVVVIGGAKMDIKPDKIIRMRPVYNLSCNQILVRDQVFATVAGDDWV